MSASTRARPHPRAQGPLAWLLTLDGLVAELALAELEDVIALTARAKTYAKRITKLKPPRLRRRCWRCPDVGR